MLKRASFLSFLCVFASFGAEIVLPSNALERDKPVQAVYRTNWQATGKGTLSLQWTDVHGRVVDDRNIPVVLNDEMEIGFTLDLRRAAAIDNELRAHFSFEGVDKKGGPDKREEDAKIRFIAKPDRNWWDYIILMWERYPTEHVAILKTLGVNAGQSNGRSYKPPEFLLQNDLRWYAENIATDYYSEYHRWRPDRIQHWSFLQAKELYKKDPASKEPFKRRPSFSDPAWRKMIHDRLVDSARFHSRYRPVFYSLADEAGIADLAAYWDFDFSDQSLVEMRVWLKERYGSLAALNAQWGSAFTDWNLVTPETTNEAMKRTDDNFSAWANHKEWMDVSFARALEMGVKAVKSVDPEAYVGIGGAQMPGWGGYDYYRLANVLTAVEPYDIGNNIEIIRSINPKVAVVTTAFAKGLWEKHRVWYELLHGARGQLIWDDANGFVTKEGAVGERGKEAEPYYSELRRGIATLLMNSERQADPIAIHYSQASMRTEWMLAQKPNGDAWVNRGSATERRDSEFLRMRESWCRLVEDLGLQYNFVGYGQVEDGELLRRGYKVLVLPRSTSLSDQEAQAMREFVAQGGTLITDAEPGVFDESSRRLPKAQLADLFAGAVGQAGAGVYGRGRAIRLGADVLNYHQNRLVHKEGDVHQLVGKLMNESGVRPAFVVTDATGKPAVGVETHRFRNGGATVIGLLSNPQLRVDELGPPEFKSNERFEKPRTVRLALPEEMYAYDIRGGKALGRKKEVTVTLDPNEPAVFAFAPVAVPGLEMAAPARVKRGTTARIGLRMDGDTPAAAHVLHVEVAGPDGKVVAHYSGNVLAAGGHADKLVPFAHNDAVGRWTLKARDLLTGQEQAVVIDVE
jgi:Beta-galactosidase trimerisation domain/Beta-galactosidase